MDNITPTPTQLEAMDKPKKVFTRQEKYMFLLGQDRGMNYEQIQREFKLEGTMEELRDLGTELFDVNSATFELYERTIAAGGTWTEDGPFFPTLQNPGDYLKKKNIANLYHDVTRLRSRSPNAVRALQDALNRRKSYPGTPNLPIVATPLAMAIMMRDQESTQLRGPQNAVRRLPHPFRRPENLPDHRAMAASPGHPNMPPPPTVKQKAPQTITAPEPSPSMKRKTQDAPSTPEPSAKKPKQPEWTMQEIVDLEMAFYHKVPYEVIHKNLFPHRSYSSVQIRADDIKRRVQAINAVKEQQKEPEWTMQEMVHLENAVYQKMKYEDIHKHLFPYRSYSGVQMKADDIKLKVQAMNAAKEQAMNASREQAMDAARVAAMNVAKEQQNGTSTNTGLIAEFHQGGVAPTSFAINITQHITTPWHDQVSGVQAMRAGVATNQKQDGNNSANAVPVAGLNQGKVMPPSLVTNGTQQIATPWRTQVNGVQAMNAGVATNQQQNNATPANPVLAAGLNQVEEVVVPPAVVANSGHHNVACPGCCADCCWAIGCREVAVPPAFAANKRHHYGACPGCCASCCWARGCVQAADLGPPSLVANSRQHDSACPGCCASCCWAKGCVRAANHREYTKVGGLPQGAGSM